MYEEILLPTDGSPGAEAALNHAIHLAAQNDAVLHAVHSVGVMERGDVTEDLADGDDELQERAWDILDPIRDAAETADVPVQKAVLEGDPSETLVEYAESEPIDLIVMGTHGKTGLSRMLLGSTAEEVLRSASVPVLTVRDDADPE